MHAATNNYFGLPCQYSKKENLGFDGGAVSHFSGWTQTCMCYCYRKCTKYLEEVEIGVTLMLKDGHLTIWVDNFFLLSTLLKCHCLLAFTVTNGKTYHHSSCSL